jgi:hypothetical protein
LVHASGKPSRRAALAAEKYTRIVVFTPALARYDEALNSGAFTVSAERKTPSDLARRLAERGRSQAGGGAWRRETFVLPRGEAREKAREWFNRFPKAAYMTEIEFWRELPDGRIEFTMRRLPSAD